MEETYLNKGEGEKKTGRFTKNLWAKREIYDEGGGAAVKKGVRVGELDSLQPRDETNGPRSARGLKDREGMPQFVRNKTYIQADELIMENGKRVKNQGVHCHRDDM